MTLGESTFGSSKFGFSYETAIVEDLALDTRDGYAQGPERTLLAAILFDGIQAYLSYHMAKSKSSKNRYREAFYWVQSRDTDYVFSFQNVCEALGIDPSFLRLGLENSKNEEGERKRNRRHF